MSRPSATQRRIISRAGRELYHLWRGQVSGSLSIAEQNPHPSA